jgi:hypothetical protein
MSSSISMVHQGMFVMERYTGVIPGYRRAHSRGHGFSGYFEATSEVAELTVAEHLQGGQVPTIVRLSNAAGSPYAPDLSSPRRGATLGLAIAFELPSGARTPGVHRTFRPSRHEHLRSSSRSPPPCGAANSLAGPTHFACWRIPSETGTRFPA